MSRKTMWRMSASDAVTLHQHRALSDTVFLLRSYGPTGFLLREEGNTRNYKVCLGDPHTCTCPVFDKEQDLCKHICWILLRKFRLPTEHEYSFQRGLVERQISELLGGSHGAGTETRQPPAASAATTWTLIGQQVGRVQRRHIQVQDVCPICQEEFLMRRLPVSYCRSGCGNNVHISCMKVWAEHQEVSAQPQQEQRVRCPLCRQDFSSLRSLLEEVKNSAQLFSGAERERADRHLGVRCHNCRISPITGRCFRCTVCRCLFLCADCADRNVHPQHPLASRTTRRGVWLPPTGDPSLLSEGCGPLPASVLHRLPALTVRSGSVLLAHGLQCRLCLQSFTPGQRVRALPCRHKLHVDCVDPILLETNACPLDGFVLHCPLQRPGSDSDRATLPERDNAELFVPGVAVGIGLTHPDGLKGSRAASYKFGELNIAAGRTGSLPKPAKAGTSWQFQRPETPPPPPPHELQGPTEGATADTDL